MRADEKCNIPEDEDAQGFRQLVDEAKARITTIGLPEAASDWGGTTWSSSTCVTSASWSVRA